MFPFMDPVFDNRSAIFGIPGTILILAVGEGLAIAGWIWLRRIVDHDRVPRSFRATDRLDATGILTRAVVLGGAALVVVLLVLRLAR